VQAADDVASHAFAEEGEHGVHQTGQTTEEHGHGEAKGMAGVLEVAFLDAVQVAGEMRHGSASQSREPLWAGTLYQFP
jgi:hypothetical protein